MRLSLIIPVYNGEHYIFDNLRKIMKILARLKVDYELIVVDDGSKDNTYKEILKINSKRLKVLRYKQNQGKGYAIKYGFSYATGSVVGFIDADFDIHPEAINNFLKFIRKYDIVIGSKRHPLSKVNYPVKRRLLSFGYQILNRLLFNLDIKDTQVGLKLFRYKVFKNILSKATVKGYAFDLELLVNAKKLGYKIIEMPIELRYLNRKSCVCIKSIFQMLIDTLKLFWKLKMLNRW